MKTSSEEKPCTHISSAIWLGKRILFDEFLRQLYEKKFHVKQNRRAS